MSMMQAKIADYQQQKRISDDAVAAWNCFEHGRMKRGLRSPWPEQSGEQPEILFCPFNSVWSIDFCVPYRFLLRRSPAPIDRNH